VSSLVTYEELKLALGALFNPCFDDDGDSVADVAAVEQCIRGASAKVESWLLANYPEYETPDPVPDILKEACFDYCRVTAAQRAPQFFSAASEVKWTDFEGLAVKNMERFKTSAQRLKESEGGPPEIEDDGIYVTTYATRGWRP